jgi:hypothetical protein
MGNATKAVTEGREMFSPIVLFTCSSFVLYFVLDNLASRKAESESPC